MRAFLKALIPMVAIAAAGCSSPSSPASPRCAGVVCSASDDCHEAGVCDPETGTCSNPAKPDGEACSDGDACTQLDTCEAGSCVGASPVTCLASDQCHAAGTCDPATGTCSDPPLLDGTGCDDGSACTQADTCQAGACVGSDPVVCTPLDPCHVAGTCDPTTGTCSNPARPDGEACSDGDACTQLDTCEAGSCVAGSPVTCVPGQACNPASGACEGDALPFVVAVSPADGATGIGVNAELQVTFSEAMSPETLTAAATPGPCTGSLQLSSDGFATCIGLGAPDLTAGGTVATLAPAGGLSFGTTYRARITTAVQGAGGQAMAAEVVQAGGFTTRVDACGSGLVISQVYGGGGEVGGLYRMDFVELRNAGVELARTRGMALQFPPAAGGGSWTVQALPDAVVPAGGYFLVQEAAGADSTQPALPTPDFVPGRSEVVDIAASSGTVALTSSTVALVGQTMTRAVVDRVGFGSHASVFETDPGPAASTSTAVARLNGGCADADDNRLDLAVVPPAPRNSQISAGRCACTANETGSALEMDFCSLHYPDSTVIQVGTGAGIYARVFEGGFTEPSGASSAIAGEIGYGLRTVNPSTHPDEYVWASAVFNAQALDDDEYAADLIVPTVGEYGYAARFARDGRSWTYCDLDGAGASAGLAFDPHRLGSLSVTEATAPVVTISTPPAEGEVNSQSTVSFTISTDEPAIICWGLDVPPDTCSPVLTTTLPTGNLAVNVGGHTLSVVATDAAGNMTVASRNWTTVTP